MSQILCIHLINWKNAFLPATSADISVGTPDGFVIFMGTEVIPDEIEDNFSTEDLPSKEFKKKVVYGAFYSEADHGK